MECIQLSKERHKLCTGSDEQPIYDSQGSLVVLDVIDKNIISVPISEESLMFFNLQKIILDNNKSESPNLKSSNAFMNTQSSAQHASWKDNSATRRLIYAWKEHESNFKGGKMKSSEVWKSIAAVLANENGQWVYTAMQCENKFKELRKKYVKVKDHNKQSGNNPMTCKFFNEFEEVLGDKPCIQSVALASNLKKRLTSCSSQDSSEDMQGKENLDEFIEKKKIRKTRVQRELGEWSSSLREDARRREEAREQRHKELVAASDRAVAAYKEMMGKLIDKV